MTRNEIFACAVDWLYAHGKITDQTDLAQKTGITETTISRILNNKVRKPSEDSLRRLNAAFDNIFNPRWLRGESDRMFLNEEQEEPQKSPLEQGLENLLQVAAQLIKDNEEQRRELHSCIQELREAIAMLNQGKTYHEPIQDNYGVSESISKLKK